MPTNCTAKFPKSHNSEDAAASFQLVCQGETQRFSLVRSISMMLNIMNENSQSEA